METPFIRGEKIDLRGLKKEDLKGNMFNWANDPEVTHYMCMGVMPNSIELMEEEYDQLTQSKSDVVFAMIDKETEAHFGNAGLYTINWLYRHAEFRIIIGEKDYWSKGFGTEAAQLVLEYGFNKLNLNKIWLGVNVDHEGAVRSYEKAGFVKEGSLRDEIYRNGRYYDALRMSILRKEWEEKQFNKATTNEAAI